MYNFGQAVQACYYNRYTHLHFKCKMGISSGYIYGLFVFFFFFFIFLQRTYILIIQTYVPDVHRGWDGEVGGGGRKN